MTAIVVKSHGHGLFHDMTMPRILLHMYVYQGWAVLRIYSSTAIILPFYHFTMAFYQPMTYPFTKLISKPFRVWLVLIMSCERMLIARGRVQKKPHRTGNPGKPRKSSRFGKSSMTSQELVLQARWLQMA